METCKTKTKHQCDKVNTKLIYQIFQGKWKREGRRFRNSSVPFLIKSCVTKLCHVSFRVWEQSVHSGIKTCLMQASDYRNMAMRLGFWSSDKSGFTMVANGVVVFVNAVLPKAPNHRVTVIVKWPEHKANGRTHHSYCRVQCHTAASLCCPSLASSGYGGGLMERMELPRRGGGGWGVGGGVHLTKGSLAISTVEPTCHDRLLNTKTGPHKFVGFW